MDIDKLKKIARGATPGPWYAIPHPEWRGANWRVDTRPGTDWANFGQIAYMSGANARFVAAFNPKTVLELLDKLQQLEKSLDRIAYPPTYGVFDPMERMRQYEQIARKALEGEDANN